MSVITHNLPRGCLWSVRWTPVLHDIDMVVHWPKMWTYSLRWQTCTNMECLQCFNAHMRQFCLSKKHVGSITTYQNHVSTLCGWLEKMLPLRTLFFSFNEDVPLFFIFLEKHVVISPAFASPTFLINYQPNSANHDINVWWEREWPLWFFFLFTLLRFLRRKGWALGPRLRNTFGLPWRIFAPAIFFSSVRQLFLDLVSLVFLLCGSPGYWSYHVFRKNQKKNCLEYPFVDRTSDTEKLSW